MLYVLEDLVEIDEPAAKDLLRVLSNRHFDTEIARMGDECHFDPKAHYVETCTSPPAEFDAGMGIASSKNLKTFNARFFSRTGAAFLASGFSKGLGNVQKEDVPARRRRSWPWPGNLRPLSCEGVPIG